MFLMILLRPPRNSGSATEDEDIGGELAHNVSVIAAVATASPAHSDTPVASTSSRTAATARASTADPIMWR